MRNAGNNSGNNNNAKPNPNKFYENRSRDEFDNNMHGRKNRINNRNNRNFRGNSNFQGNRNDNYQMDSFSNQTGQSTKSTINKASDSDADQKTPEEIAFDEQFRKWEEQFLNWKRDNANHPDRKAYQDYETKMEECRTKLLARREEMRRRRLEKAHAENDQQETHNEPDNQQSDARNANEEKNVSNASNDRSTEDVYVNEECENVDDNENGSSVFGASGHSDGVIPGLDLVATSSESTESKNEPKSQQIAPDVSTINNLLGDPNIHSLLSNIQQAASQPQLNRRAIPSLFEQNVGNPFNSVGSNNDNTRSNSNEPSAHFTDRMNPLNRPNQTNNPPTGFDYNQPNRNDQFGNNFRNQNTFDRPFENFGNQAENQGNKSNANTSYRSLMDLNLQNPFSQNPNQGAEQRHLVEDNSNDGNQSFNNEFSENSGGRASRMGKNRFKRMMRGQKRDVDQQPAPFGCRDQLGGDSFSQQQQTALNQMNDRRNFNDMNFNSSELDRKRAHPDTFFDSDANNRFGDMRNSDFYRPAKIIDYQNQSQTNPEFCEFFPRKLIEYNHRPRVHVVETFCPTQIIDYSHGSTANAAQRQSNVSAPFRGQSSNTQNQFRRQETNQQRQFHQQSHFDRYDDSNRRDNVPVTNTSNSKNTGQGNSCENDRLSWIRNNAPRPQRPANINT